MRKLISKTLFLIMVLFIIGIKSNTIVAIDEFPSTIQVTVNNKGYNGNASLINYGYGSLYKKVYKAPSADINTYAKAFCTTFWNYAPGAGQSFIACGNPRECTATTFTGTSGDEERRAAIGVGTIIKTARELSNGGGGINGWDYYYYAELAINRFLYTKYGKSVNNVSDISNLNSNFRKMLSAANEVYKEYNKDKIVMSDLTETNGVITTTITCKNSANNEVECSNLSTAVKVGDKDLSKVLSDNRLSKTKNGKKVILNVDLSDYSAADSLDVSITATNTKTYYMAKNYKCGNCNGRPFQNMTPNLLKPVSTKKIVTKEISIKPPTPETNCPKALEEKISITGGSWNYNYGELPTLYNTYGYGNLLNVNDPSCSNPKSEENLSCEKTTFNAKFNSIFTTNENNKLTGYCALDYILDSSIFSDAISKSGGIIYESADGVVATANVKYECTVPYQKALKDQTINLNIAKSAIVPKLSVSLGDKETSFSYKLTQTGKSGHTSFDGNNITIATTLKNSGYVIWNFQGEITYYYDKKLSVNKDNSQEIKLGGCNDEENCMELNYGIIAPNNNAGKYTSTLKLNTDYTLYEEGNLNSKTTTCNYELIETKNENSFNYRTIDTSTPFLTKDGDERYTGRNWCAHATIDEKVQDEIQNSSDDEINSNITGDSCNYRGDINKNGIWDNNDIELLNKCINSKNCDLSMSDINYDGKVDSEDVDALKNYITADYQKGDVNLNGRLDSEDAIIIQKYNNGYDIELSELQKKLADVNSNCKIELLDAVMLDSAGYQKGDVNLNGVLDSEDVIIIEKYIANIFELSELQKKLADVNSDGEITIMDVITLQKMLVPDDKEPNYTKTIYSSEHICSATNNTVENYITYRPNSDGNLTTIENGKTTTKKVEPLYSFTLTPDNIKKIREYNKKNTYDDFSLECKDSKECVSSFVTTMFTDSSFAKESSGLCKVSSEKKEFCNVLSVLGLEGK